MGDFTLKDLFDSARGVFKDAIDFEKFKFELRLANEARAAEAEQAARQAPAVPGGDAIRRTLPLVIGLAVVGFVAVKLIK